MRSLLAIAVLASACRVTPATDDAPRDTDARDTEPTSTDSDPSEDSDTTAPGSDQRIAAFSATQVSFTGEDNRRTVDVEVAFPAASETYASIALDVALGCPNDRCDPWDRWGFVGVVLDAGTDRERVVELSRFVTPYGKGTSWSLDVTDLRPLLTGTVTVRVFIDTWVGPGSEYGDGWSVDASFVFAGGRPPRRVLGVVPVWTTTAAVYGDPARTLASQVVPASVQLPAGTTSTAVRAFVTGHGQGNAGNCAEFCSKTHALTIDGTEAERVVWRDDCATTAEPGQAGTWKYSRAGWCPGAQVLPWVVTRDVSDTSLDVGWDVDDYTNTCRPDEAECSGCTLGTGCEFDGGAHTEPFYEVSAVVIAYGD